MILAAGLSPAWQQTLVFERLRLGEVNRAVEVRWTASGKALNAARTAARLARAMGLPGGGRGLTVIGGPSGEAMERSLAAEGTPVTFVRSATPSRTCTTVISRADGTMTELVENARPISPEDLDEFRRLFRRDAREAQAIVLLGSLPGGTPSAYYRSLLEGVEAPAILDVRGPELLAALELRPFLVKPNREELGMTVGRPIAGEAELRKAMEEVRRRGARWVVITAGRDAVWALGEGGFRRFRPPAVTALNPIGSGDSLATGIACSIVRGADPVEAIRYGVACGSANAETLLPGDFDPARADELVERVEVESV